MQLKRFRRYFHRQVREQQKQVESFSQATEKSIERNLFRRFNRLKPVRRFVITWVTLMVLLMATMLAQFQQLAGYYQTVQPVPGGIFTEGVLGSISNVNPIYANSDVDRSLSRLVFAGLLSNNENGELVPRLAERYETLENGKIYKVYLKKGLTWHDGKPLTSADVLFTFNAIKNPESRSPLQNSWQNVEVAAVDDHTITFTLPSTLASFPFNLATGIIPEHILGDVTAANLRSADFNTIKPVGAGPFEWRGLEVSGTDPDEIEEQVALAPFEKFTEGEPKLSQFILRAYRTEAGLSKAYESGQLSAAAGLNTEPENSPSSTVRNDLLANAGTYVFFNNSNPLLSSVKVRQALVAASNPSEIINKLDFMTRPVTGPLLSGQLGFNKAYNQKTADVATAQRLLAEDGWSPVVDGKITKNGQPLRFSVTATDTPENRLATNELRKQWQAIGVQMTPQLIPATDFSTVLAGHDYEAVLYGIALGTDPDVYAYWESSQADARSLSRLNLSEWKNGAADAALQAGRTRIDPALRIVKYAPFLQAWQQDAPALGLYQPRFMYLTRGPLYGLTERPISSITDRYNGVYDWQIRTARVTAE